MKTFAELFKEIKDEIIELTPAQVNEIIKNDKGVILIDVREKDEVTLGYIENAITIPRGFLELKIERQIPERNSQIIVYCAGGTRSVLAVKSLKEMGYTNIASMSGGFEQWKIEGFKFVKDDNINFTPEQVIRYSRQILLPEVGEKGQAKLLKSKVLIVGAGGLGSPSAYYLAAAGVGTIGIIDADIVDLSNLHRQILHTTLRVGQPKVESAKETLKSINPDINIVTFKDRLGAENALDIIKNYDLVIDGTDNFATKYLINDACFFLGKPNIYGSIFKFEGQLTVFNQSRESPCYRCLFPSPPPPELAPNCAETGVLGVLPGVIGILQAVEAIKLILEKGEILTGKLLTYDSLSTSFRTIKIKKNKECSLCSEHKTVNTLIDYDNFCYK